MVFSLKIGYQEINVPKIYVRQWRGASEQNTSSLFYAPQSYVIHLWNHVGDFLHMEPTCSICTHTKLLHFLLFWFFFLFLCEFSSVSTQNNNNYNNIARTHAHTQEDDNVFSHVPSVRLSQQYIHPSFIHSWANRVSSSLIYIHTYIYTQFLYTYICII